MEYNKHADSAIVPLGVGGAAEAGSYACYVPRSATVGGLLS